MSRIGAVIPAAGLSSRMQRFKPLLPLGRGTVLSECVDTFLGNGVDRIVVVTGKRADEVAAAALAAGAEAVHNAHFAEGMFSSILTGVKALGNVEAFFVLPVDIPLVRRETVARVLETYDARRPAVLYPRFLGERGHPPLIGREAIPSILAHDGEGGLRAVLDTFESEAAELDVADFGTVHDLDFPDDYEVACGYARRAFPCPEEVAQLFLQHSVSPEVIAHSRAVATVAVALMERVNSAPTATGRLDGALVESAALVHDIAKGEKAHGRVGAERLASHGFHVAAEVVRDHCDLQLGPGAPLSEREIVFLADKLVAGDQYIPLRTRFEEKLARFGDKPDARTNILARLDRAEVVLQRFNKESGVSAESIAREVLG
ncbi:NTP transferase domain-containing protein [Pseudodesulfovibrio cashew]|uniref:NTP transferase domain-containing protein n=1 Tax=Pseudodesulfovibrio cashew TaxID=2678688 RepID=A0A6I6JKH5_9BACT|nr:NTP transferase domain-containing protein [Pseudodesulfovibrio cashew]QGY41490.1 NTP transferase domain-containing protein [Pseudodesulfovibrio cashew]